MMAIESGNLELFKLLISHGGDVSLKCFSEIDNQEYSCAAIASKFGAKTIHEHLTES